MELAYGELSATKSEESDSSHTASGSNKKISLGVAAVALLASVICAYLISVRMSPAGAHSNQELWSEEQVGTSRSEEQVFEVPSSAFLKRGGPTLEQGGPAIGQKAYPGWGKPATNKKGISGVFNLINGKPHCRDAKVLGLGNSWFYSWTYNPNGANGYCSGKNRVAREYVPMINGVKAAETVTTKVPKAIREGLDSSNAHFLLGYNEPDFSPNHPHSVSPKEGAEAWWMVQNFAATFDPPLILVSPCPSSEAFDDSGRSWWLDQFFGNCTGKCDPSLIKYIAMHDYTGDAELMMKRIEGAAKIYGRQIWLTEYAIIVKGRCKGHTPSAKAHADYLKETIPLLEASKAVYRYAWFASRQKANTCAGNSALLPSSNPGFKLSKFGQLYKKIKG